MILRSNRMEKVHSDIRGPLYEEALRMQDAVEISLYIRRKLRADSAIRRLFCIKRTDKGDIAVIICVILRSRYNRIIMRKVAAERQIKNMPRIFSTKLRIECIVKKKDIIAVVL